MKKIVIVILCLFAIEGVAQTEYDSVLQQIEANNSTLNFLRQDAEAKKLNARTGIYLPDPEIEFNYLWGKPAESGNRKDISITQSFDFPTVYANKNKISKLENTNAELAYRSERINVLLLAKQVCIQLVYNNAMIAEYKKRLQNAKTVAIAYTVKLDNGETNAIEYNKAQLNLANAENELHAAELEQKSLLFQLKQFNGGIDVNFTCSTFSIKSLPADFEQWYAQAEEQNTMLQYIKGQIAIDRQQIKLTKSMQLPKITAGYMREQVVGERFEGITIGISLPLWENKNRVKQAKTQMKATEANFNDKQIILYNSMKDVYEKAAVLKQLSDKYDKALQTYNNEKLLTKAFDAGEISLLQYLQESAFYYEIFNKKLEAERDFELIFAQIEIGVMYEEN